MQDIFSYPPRTCRVPADPLRTRCVPAAYSPRTCFVYTRHLHQMASVSLRRVCGKFGHDIRPDICLQKLQETYRELSGHFPGTLGTPSGNLQRTFWKPSGTFRCLLVRVGDGRQWDGIVLTVVVIAPRGDGRGRHTEAADCLSFWVRRVGRELPRRHVLLSAPGRACSPFPADVIAVG